jgi:opacity protein-like surface antigen
MARTTRILVAIAVIVPLLQAARASASWRIDVEGGAFIPVGDFDVESRIGDAGDVSVDFDVGPGFAVGGGYAPLRWFEIAAHVHYGYADTDTFLSDNVEVFSFTAGGRVFPFPWERVRPFGIFELGWYRAEVDGGIFSSIRADQTDDSFGINIGGGADFMINRRVSLGADVRYHNAFDAFEGFDFVTTMFNVGIHFGR